MKRILTACIIAWICLLACAPFYYGENGTDPQPADKTENSVENSADLQPEKESGYLFWIFDGMNPGGMAGVIGLFLVAIVLLQTGKHMIRKAEQEELNSGISFDEDATLDPRLKK